MKANDCPTIKSHDPQAGIPSDVEWQCLAPAQHPLLVRFYRNNQSRNRVRPQAQCWVARRGEIIAGLCLTSVENGYFLTGLLVAPERRNQGVGAALVQRALSDIQAPVWLFCRPQLQGFYAELGFAHAQALPATLADRLARYRQNKTLIALQRDRGTQCLTRS